MIVEAELEKLGFNRARVQLGEIELPHNLTDAERETFRLALNKWGLELIDDRSSILIEKIKSAIVEMVYTSDRLPEITFSTYLSQKLHYNYTYLSNTFSHVMGLTIEQFIMTHKIERAKELMAYNELSINQIADKLRYSSGAHLSNQFRKMTGLTPSFFKMVRCRNR